MKTVEPLVIAGTSVAPGSNATITIPIPQLYTHTPMEMPVHVVRGKRVGPTLFVCAAIHGDELNGVEIVRRLVHKSPMRRLCGTLIAIPIVNVYGVIHHSRYLPDRRDLNRSFPGTGKGSLASRLANLLMTECVENATHAIDLHTGALHRSNIPQVRCDMNKPETMRMAEAFGAPVIIDSKIRDGSLREAADDLDIPIIIYEAGEALRFDERAIQAGVAGIRSVMRELGMLGQVKSRQKPIESLVVSSSAWTRAPISGIFHTGIRLGQVVDHDDVLGSIADPFGETEEEILSRHKGMVIGRTYLPLVNEGDAVIHIAQTDAIREAADTFAEFIDR